MKFPTQKEKSLKNLCYLYCVTSQLSFSYSFHLHLAKVHWFLPNISISDQSSDTQAGLEQLLCDSKLSSKPSPRESEDIFHKQNAFTCSLTQRFSLMCFSTCSFPYSEVLKDFRKAQRSWKDGGQQRWFRDWVLQVKAERAEPVQAGRRLGGDLMKVCQYLQEGCQEDGPGSASCSAEQ